jgi:hypothetical protein
LVSGIVGWRRSGDVSVKILIGFTEDELKGDQKPGSCAILEIYIDMCQIINAYMLLIAIDLTEQVVKSVIVQKGFKR